MVQLPLDRTPSSFTSLDTPPLQNLLKFANPHAKPQRNQPKYSNRPYLQIDTEETGKTKEEETQLPLSLSLSRKDPTGGHSEDLSRAFERALLGVRLLLGS